MTWFFYENGRVEEQPASLLEFKSSLGIIDADDGVTVRTFDREPAHVRGRYTVIYVQRGTKRSGQLRSRIAKCLSGLVKPRKPVPLAE